MKSKVLYEVDPHNRLVVRSSGKKSNVKKFRQVVYGQFKIDEKNILYYEAARSQGFDTPQRIKFSGNYSLNPDHNLIFTLNKWNNQCEGNRLILGTKIIDANANEIAFLINSRMSESQGVTYVIKLSGSWQADGSNRLTFGVRRDSKKIDRLTLFGAWEITKNNEISYNYDEFSQAISFKGYWDIKDKYRLRYVLDKNTGSGFDLKVSFGQLAPEQKNMYLIFNVAIDISKRETINRKIVFSGKWKIGKTKEVILEASPGENKSINLKLTKEILNKEGLAYIESFIKDKEFFAGGGLSFRW